MSVRQLAMIVSSVACLLAGRPASAQRGSLVPEVGYPLEFKVSSPVRNLPPQARLPGPEKEIPAHRPPARPRSGQVTDPVQQSSTPAPALAQSLQQWEGLGAGYPGYTVGAVPPDPNSAVGPNHIVEWVNNAFVVFNKQGVQLNPPVADSDFWGILSTCYQFGGFSDPIIQYDRAADRWLVGEVSIPLLAPILGQFAQCFAVSTSPDPTGSYYLWAYGFQADLNDFPKIGVWPDGYYITWNMFQNGATFMGARACSFDRSAMLSGAQAPARVCFQLPSNYDSLLPADVDGAASPPAGSPNFLMNINTATSEVNLWKFHVSFANPNSSTFTGPISIPGVAPFNAPCLTTQDCVPQPGTTARLDAIGDRLNYRLAYRNFGNHESIVANHTVLAAGGNTGVRWYEVRDPNGAPAIYQQGTFAPDGDYRWMGSIAMDKSGNIGLGYSVSGNTTYPSIRYTGWEVGNPLGTLQAETTMVAGGGAQIAYNRWGDYSDMRIDPSNDCTFWYTQEYQATTADANWNTRIGSFKFPSCGQTGLATTTTLTSSLNPSTYGQSVTFTAKVTPSGSGTPAGSVAFKDGAATLGSSSLDAGGMASFTTSSLGGGSHSVTAVYAGDATFSGSTSSPLSQTVNQATTGIVVNASPNPSSYGQNVTFTATVNPTAATGTVQFFDGVASLGTATLSGGVASLSSAILSVGPHSITAQYNGNSNYLSSLSSAVVLTVNQTGTATALTSSSSTSVFGQSVTFTATVSPAAGSGKPTGTVTFQDGGIVLGSPALTNGVATWSVSNLSVGFHSITAQYNGDGNYLASPLAGLTQTVNKANTTTTLTSSPNPSNNGQLVTFTATVAPSAATGTVQFFDGSAPIGSAVAVSGGQAKLLTSALASGKHSITARYSGDSNYNPSTSAVLTQTVRRKP